MSSTLPADRPLPLCHSSPPFLPLPKEVLAVKPISWAFLPTLLPLRFASSRRLPLLAVALWLTLAGCGLPLIHGTKLPATRENQEVYAVVLRYKEAMSKANWSDLLQIVSPRFHETRGTPDPSDDYGFDELRERMNHANLKKVQIVRYSLDVEKIEYPNPQEAHVYVTTRFTYRYPQSSERTGLDTGPDRHLLVFENHRGRWMILRGI